VPEIPATLEDAMTELVAFMQRHWSDKADHLLASEPAIQEISEALTNFLWVGRHVDRKVRGLPDTHPDYEAALDRTTQLIYSLSVAVFLAARANPAKER